MLWPSIKQLKSTQNFQTQGCHVLALMAIQPFHNITWLAYEEDIPSVSTSSRPSNLPTSKLNYSSNLCDALKTHMHSKHKLGHANPTTGYYSYYKGSLPSAHKNISNAFWTMFNLLQDGEKQFPLPHRHPFQSEACCSIEDLDQSSMPPVSSLRQCPAHSVRLSTPDYLWYDNQTPQHCM